MVDSALARTPFFPHAGLTFIPHAGRMVTVVEDCVGALSCKRFQKRFRTIPGARKTMAPKKNPILLTTPEDLLNVIFQGKSTVTIQSSSGKRFTYEFTTPTAKGPDGKPLKNAKGYNQRESGGNTAFAGLLREADNSKFRYAFMVYRVAGGFMVRCSAKGCVTKDAPSYKAMEFVSSIIRQHGRLPGNVQIWVSTYCRMCGRKLSSEWALQGIGPECAKK